MCNQFTLFHFRYNNSYLVKTGNNQNLFSSPKTCLRFLLKPKLKPFLSVPCLKIGALNASKKRYIGLAFLAYLHQHPHLQEIGYLCILTTLQCQDHDLPNVDLFLLTSQQWYPNREDRLIENMAAAKNKNMIWNLACVSGRPFYKERKKIGYWEVECNYSFSHLNTVT